MFPERELGILFTDVTMAKPPSPLFWKQYLCINRAGIPLEGLVHMPLALEISPLRILSLLADLKIEAKNCALVLIFL